MQKEKDDEEYRRECRRRRRKRILTRQISATGGGGGGWEEHRKESSGSVSEGKRVRSPRSKTPASSSDDEAKPREPVFGTISVAGRSREMEDAISVTTNLCQPEINRHRPVHFFGVFDGHGGSRVAALCRDRMHVFVQEEMMRVEATREAESGVGKEEFSEAEKWRRVMKRAFERMDELALGRCSCGPHAPDQVDLLGGSTAVVAVLTQESIVVANCGDSRAVLRRGGVAVPLSVDQKPDRADELARIQAAGGRVLYVNGARVEGILAMSRAIGDRYLKPFVISEPEITITKRVPEDEFLILASDGLWDLVPNSMACQVARECLDEPIPSPPTDNAQFIEGESPATLNPSPTTLAAAILNRLALGRGSSDDISVIVIDLKRS